MSAAPMYLVVQKAKELARTEVLATYRRLQDRGEFAQGEPDEELIERFVEERYWDKLIPALDHCAAAHKHWDRELIDKTWEELKASKERQFLGTTTETSQ